MICAQRENAGYITLTDFIKGLGDLYVVGSKCISGYC